MTTAVSDRHALGADQPLLPPSTQLAEHSVLLLADSCLLWGHRLSEWCGHGPILEEDIALTNTALDLLGQARALLQLAAKRRSPVTSEDRLAYLRDAHEFHNLVLAELPNGDYAQTVLRSLLLSAWFEAIWEALATHPDRDVASIAAEAVKASRVQLRHASDWVVRFGDGTEESRQRLQVAINTLWPATAELLLVDVSGTKRETRSRQWIATVSSVFNDATVSMPAIEANEGANMERQHRVELLQEMQMLARQHPDAVW